VDNKSTDLLKNSLNCALVRDIADRMRFILNKFMFFVLKIAIPLKFSVFLRHSYTEN